MEEMMWCKSGHVEKLKLTTAKIVIDYSCRCSRYQGWDQAKRKKKRYKCFRKYDMILIEQECQLFKVLA